TDLLSFIREYLNDWSFYNGWHREADKHIIQALMDTVIGFFDIVGRNQHVLVYLLLFKTALINYDIGHLALEPSVGIVIEEYISDVGRNRPLDLEVSTDHTAKHVINPCFGFCV